MTASIDYQKVLACKLASMFQTEPAGNQASSILQAYGQAEHERQASRVKLAILKLAGSDLAEIERYTAIAKWDYRDVLSWAEYPTQSAQRSMPEGPEKQNLVTADRQEYEEWLKL